MLSSRDNEASGLWSFTRGYVMAGKSGKGQYLGAAEYRQGARERIGEAFTLLRSEQFSGSVYMAGRGVEGMLRAVVWKNDPEIRQGKKSLDTGHDLRNLLTLVGNLGLLQAGGRDDEFVSNVQKVGRLWFNNMRFASNKFVEIRWRTIGEIDHRRTLKRAASDYYEACSAVIKRCEVLCQP